MNLSSQPHETDGRNPLDVIEDFVVRLDWAFDRRSDEEMAVEVPGKWCNYSMFLAWREDLGSLHLTLAFDMKVQPDKKAEIHTLLAYLNERLWLGHFGLWTEESQPVFRYALLLGSAALSIQQAEDMIDAASAECERCYPAFQFVVWGGKTAKDALESAMLDTMGEA